MDFDFLMPTQLRFGAGRFQEAADLAQRLGRRALLITARNSMERLGHTQRITSALRAHGINVTVYREIRPSPTTNDVDRGAALARAEEVDFIIALGGGSALDCAKAIAAVAPGNRLAADYLFQEVAVSPDTLPMMAIPTTAGTGSEVNRSCIITDQTRSFKDGIRSHYLFPRYAIVDPTLTHSVSSEVTAQTGFDALAHAIESYVSPRAQPIADALALRAVEAISRCLPVALDDPQHAEAREQLALASTTMGFNLACVGTCFPHRADKSLSALHPEIAHGQSIALFYPYWAKYSYSGNIERFARISQLIEPKMAGLSTERGAAAFVEVITAFIHRIGLGRKMVDFGVTEEEIPTLAQNVAGDLSVNPVPVRRENLSEIFAEVLSGG